MSARILVAGIGNVFCSDDGFGSAVAARLAAGQLPAGVEVTDYGIRGVHLAYQLLEPYDLVVLVDAVQRGGRPGSVYLIEPDAVPPDGAVAMDAHEMTPEAVLALVPQLGGTLGRVLIVGCEPAELGPGMTLTDPVAAAVDEAARAVLRLVAEPAGVEAGGSV